MVLRRGLVSQIPKLTIHAKIVHQFLEHILVMKESFVDRHAEGHIGQTQKDLFAHHAAVKRVETLQKIV